jgi:sterol desaturase/sphingolipid hydroxylase (fatty acid hydroxylase superfamily)
MDTALEQLLAWKGLAVAAWLLLFVLAERLRPAAPAPSPIRPDEPATDEPRGGWHRVARNLGLWLANVGLSPLIVLPASLWASQHGLPWRPVWWGAWWSGWGGLLLDLLLLDFLIYWWHRANHEWSFLWRFHEVHHLDRFLDSTSALRFHFGEVLLSAGARAVVIIVFAIPITSVLAFETLVLVATIFHHSNLALPAGLERALARLVITPSIHWVHHHDRRADTDSNYGTVLSFWDPIFGTRSPTRRDPAMTIGVEGRGERPFLDLLLWPFRGAAARGATPASR